ncbi:MAG: hypothetical protein UX85_C0001G0166 [Candidatus Beckwithbacteria bacterium GW2011_GWB1_47_15]|uniref:DUF3800 domain-containing protein n=1 Tax=Candidatus Beckwithbacteria bacterium GW2011_GWB1_47_15 TaxID=1618371 RepID=A0A0G1RXV9_9BACT|nr:MAG: hypothetical protein UY43_C0001G0960 [Candidatus Beckwithbacteria bacterium GW2011_GWC1_49_16]AQS30803.1 hypothetical protein [uncultured bacterium]KKU35988.1 MAG: hypothetical protein UX50_C0001G0165 [Candidatus Beckwithbacteria bacterium GW2011_GWA1_46_30]KKU61952.1 MAG: hypothetical protein UX85_C0001G0166 [Candidatus Beckwithbacteria bacterium GW2011_GWB1_47_15]KKU72494.1 MAG: hypothetical protein UX97_C0001G0364 [Candidatus Beckwithbacteria bacterium GW2011_GWA2_47_25]KKW04339.1 M
MKNYFAFIDESGNSTQERFFGLGLMLMDDEIGDFYDAMKPHYEKAFNIAKSNKITRVKELEKNADLKQLSSLASSHIHFELKFKYVNFTNNVVYRDLVATYFNFKEVRFCALIIDRQTYSNTTKKGITLNPWDVYINQASMLLANNIREITPCNVCVLADDLSKPTYIKKSFEKSLKDALEYRLKKRGISNSVFGVTRLESHSSLLLQVSDILLGAVMYDYKKKIGLISEKLSQRQEIVTEKIRSILKTKSLAVNKTFHQPNYFSVWELKKP